MPTVRGFVQRLEVGRAGLVRATLVHPDASTGTYVIRDLDADPERFNERLSKLGILRDAMTRAEPVEIEHNRSQEQEVIDRVARITRDELGPARNADQVAGLVLDVEVLARNHPEPAGEFGDRARVVLLVSMLEPRVLILPLQIPERAVAAQQLEILRQAQTEGRVARLTVDVSEGPHEAPIFGVALDNASAVFGDRDGVAMDGFVESLSLLRPPLPAAQPLASNLAHVRFTTAPTFTGDGNTVDLAPFTPVTLDLLVPRSSATYDLFKAGLRDNLRMRTTAVLYRAREPQDDREEEEELPSPTVAEVREEAGAQPGASAGDVPMVRILARSVAEGPGGDPESAFGIALGAELLAPLASASRPVWLQISRNSLDRGPEGEACTLGVPTHDLSPATLRDLRLPYPAAWKGLACFNPGVYRFQLQLPSPFTVWVDGEELCLFPAAENGGGEGVMLAHACLDGHHEVVVKIERWRCEDDFSMDVYRLR